MTEPLHPVRQAGGPKSWRLAGSVAITSLVWHFGSGISLDTTPISH